MPAEEALIDIADGATERATRHWFRRHTIPVYSRMLDVARRRAPPPSMLLIGNFYQNNQPDRIGLEDSVRHMDAV